MEVGTPCTFEGAVASEVFSGYSGSDRHCYDPQLLEYTEPVRCSVTGLKASLFVNLMFILYGICINLCH